MQMVAGPVHRIKCGQNHWCLACFVAPMNRRGSNSTWEQSELVNHEHGIGFIDKLQLNNKEKGILRIFARHSRKTAVFRQQLSQPQPK
jgi:hypothetical protein